VSVRWTEEELAARGLGARVRDQTARRPATVQGPAPASRPSKYGATREGDFDSRREARRYRELRLLLRAGEVVWLARQVAFALPGETEYRADFVYRTAGGELVVEDVKSPPTRTLPAYRIKVRQMQAIHGITVREVE
jgi:hypothetical protein